MRALRVPMLLDVAIAGSLSLLTALATVTNNAISLPGVILAVLSVAPLAIRQLFPTLCLMVISVALIVYAGLRFADTPGAAVGLLIAVFTVGVMVPRPVAAALLVFPAAVLLTSWWRVDGVSVVDVGQGVVVVLCVWGLGDSTRRWALRARDAAADAQRSVAENRTVIARELHDVVAHHMSVVALHTGLAGYATCLIPIRRRRVPR